MSTPLVPITENTFILPLNGNLTDERFEKITETVISSINISRADYLILDLSGLGTFNENTLSSLTTFSSVQEAVKSFQKN
ncbi:STAS domain-containing protein [Fictibacillus sp. WQ 8-8]|uniref:STAS domain-containing protein n=1 Tax=Fictibacillus sp. WQ 8-8 TaxID=2938788 RepID=UPI002735951B|nr:STAS domain-containing protein [Fictibacillus sp. WQ 8-8]